MKKRTKNLFSHATVFVKFTGVIFANSDNCPQGVKEGPMCSHQSYTTVNHSPFKTNPKISNSDFFIHILISKTSNRKKNNYFFLFEV